MSLPQDAVVLGQAQAFFVNGLAFEGWLGRLVEATGFKGEVVVASEGVATHSMDEDGHTITGTCMHRRALPTGSSMSPTSPRGCARWMPRMRATRRTAAYSAQLGRSTAR